MGGRQAAKLRNISGKNRHARGASSGIPGNPGGVSFSETQGDLVGANLSMKKASAPKPASPVAVDAPVIAPKSFAEVLNVIRQCTEQITISLIGAPQPPRDNVFFLNFPSVRIYPSLFIWNALRPMRDMLLKVESFAEKNDLSPEKLECLMDALADFIKASNTIECPDGTKCSVDEFAWICPSACDADFTFETLRILRDAKFSNQTGLKLEKGLWDAPPGKIPSVHITHTNDGRALALKFYFRGLKSSKSVCVLGTPDRAYARSLATSRLQEMLTKIGLIDVPHVIAIISAAEGEGNTYIASEYVEGTTIHSAIRDKNLKYRMLKNNELIRREMWIQLMDVLTGEMDRHNGNVVLTPEGHAVAIDHDQSFPVDITRSFASMIPNKLIKPNYKYGWSSIDGRSKRNFAIPPVVDKEMYEIFMAIDLGELKSMYEDCGLVKIEIDAALARAAKLKALLEEYKKDGKVIDPGEWHLQKCLTMENSYAMYHLNPPVYKNGWEEGFIPL